MTNRSRVRGLIPEPWHEADRDCCSYRRRLFDCCARSRTGDKKRWDDNETPLGRGGGRTSSTYGTYIYPDTRRYSFSDASICPCTCCPHNSHARGSSVPRHVSRQHQYEQQQPYQQHHQRQPLQQRPPSFSAARSPRGRGHRFEYRPSGYDEATPATAAAASWADCSPRPTQAPRSSSSSSALREARGERRQQRLLQPDRNSSGYRCSTSSHGDKDKDRIVVEVVDKTDGPLSQRHGNNSRRFCVLLASAASSHDIISLLVQDRRRQKVMVRWENGALEPLDELVTARALGRHARQLELKRRKSVHWR